MVRRKTLEQRLNDNINNTTEMSAIGVILAPIAAQLLLEAGRALISRCLNNRDIDEIKEMVNNGDRRVNMAIRRELRKRGLHNHPNVKEMMEAMKQTLIQSNNNEIEKALQDE